MATDKKVTQLDSLTSLSGDDLFMVVDDPSVAPVNKKITATSIFSDLRIPLNVTGNTMIIASNTNITGNMSIAGNTDTTIAGSVTLSANTNVTGELRLMGATPSTNNTSTESIGTGKIWADQDYIYVAVSNTVIKRVQLSVF